MPKVVLWALIHFKIKVRFFISKKKQSTLFIGII